jgi:hypothetical protein
MSLIIHTLDVLFEKMLFCMPVQTILCPKFALTFVTGKPLHRLSGGMFIQRVSF